MLDLPAPVHLLHHELGVHIELHLVCAQLHRGLEAAQQAVVFGHVIGGLLPHHVGDFLQQLRAVLVVDRRARTGYPGVATGAAVSEDD